MTMVDGSQYEGTPAGNGTLTMLACPKPFTGHVALIQRNAITSWTRLEPRPRILLFGDEPGTKAICDQLHLEHACQVQRNDRGTPLLSDILEQGQRLAGGNALCFINADIILMDDFAQAVERVTRAKTAFVMVGQRTDLEVTAPIIFDRPDWQESLRAAAAERGRLHGKLGIDYFVFTPGLFDPVPPLLIGRAAVDNWLVFRARRAWRPVVDATASITAVHQNHDYSHHPAGREGVYRGEEAQTNLRLAGGPAHLFGIGDRTHVLTPRGVSLDLSPVQLRRHWDRLPAIVPPPLGPIVSVLRVLWRSAGAARRALGWRGSRT